MHAISHNLLLATKKQSHFRRPASRPHTAPDRDRDPARQKVPLSSRRLLCHPTLSSRPLPSHLPHCFFVQARFHWFFSVYAPARVFTPTDNYGRSQTCTTLLAMQATIGAIRAPERMRQNGWFHWCSRTTTVSSRGAHSAAGRIPNMLMGNNLPAGSCRLRDN